ncbi:MAG: hypothetical protein AABY64_14655 [Bdellovibrionota bacterium]
MFSKQVLILSILFGIGILFQLGHLFFSSSEIIDRNPTAMESSSFAKKEISPPLKQEPNNLKQKLIAENINSENAIEARAKAQPARSEIVPLRTPYQRELLDLGVSSLDKKWHWWSKTTAIFRSNRQQGAEQALAEVEQRVVVDDQSLMSSPSEFYMESPLVLFDPSRQRVALLTGVFIVTAKSEEDFSRLENDVNFEVVNSFSHLKVVYLKPRKSPFSLNEIVQFFNKDERVQSFEFEILKGNLVKN